VRRNEELAGRVQDYPSREAVKVGAVGTTIRRHKENSETY